MMRSGGLRHRENNNEDNARDKTSERNRWGC